MKNIIFLSFLTLIAFSLKGQTYTFQNDSVILNCNTGGILNSPGGPVGNYNNNESFLFTVCPNSTNNQSIAYDFNSANFGAGDYVCVYDGPTVAAQLLDCYNSVNPTAIDSMVRATTNNASGCLTFQFYSDAALVGKFQIELFCVFPCQEMHAEIASSSVPITDTVYMDVCNGEELSITANGLFLENNLYYNQTNSNVSFIWDVGGIRDTAITFTSYLSNPGFYPVQLIMKDSAGCKTVNELNLAVRYLPLAHFAPVLDSVICLGSTVSIFDQVAGPIVNGNIIFGDTIRTANSFTVSSAAQYIPDDADNTAGNGITTPATYPINVTGFIPGSVITNGSQLFEICLDIEHSYIGDIDIVLVAPNGAQIHLVNMNPPGGPSSDFGTPVTGVNPLQPGIPDTYCWSPTSTLPVIGQNSNFGTKVPPNTYSAFGNWNNFIGSPVNGVWTIQVFDDWGGDDGNIFGASFEFDPIFIPNADSFFVSYDVVGLWDANPSIISPLNQNTIQYTASTLGPDVLYYSATNNFGCMDRDTIPIWVEGFEVNATPSDTTVCTAVPVQLNAAVVGTPPACNYTFNLADSFGDGWNGNTLTARVNGVVVGTYTISSGSSASYTLSVPGNSTLQLSYNNTGSWQFEVSYTVLLGGVVVHSAGPNPPAGVVYTNTCGGAYTFNWTPATNLNNANIANPISTLTGGGVTYVVAVSNANGCTYYDTVTVNAASSFEFAAFGDTTICAGETAQLFATGGAVTYLWTPSSGNISDSTASSPFVSPTTTTTYTVKADSTGCSQFANIQVKVSNIKVTNIIKTNATCGVANGGLIIFANGGVGPLTYTLDNGTPQANGFYNSLYGGMHSLTISDGSGCDLDTLITIGGGAPLIIDSLYTQDASCNPDGVIQIFLSNPNLVVNYTNSVTGVTQTSNTFTGLAGGTYTITISDGACPSIDTTITISQLSGVTIVVDSFENLTCFNSADGTIFASATGGSQDFTYSIDGINFQATGAFIGLDAGVYTVTAKDTSGCENTAVVTLTESDSLMVNNLVVDSGGCSGVLGSITFEGLGGTAPYMYSIDGVPTFVNTNTFSVGSGNYVIQVRDANNCLSEVVLDTVYQASGLVLTLDSVQNASCGAADGGVFVSVSGGTIPYTYSWSNGSVVVGATEDLTNIGAGIYTLTVTDAANCSSQVTGAVTDGASVDLVLISADSISCFGANDAMVVLSASLGTEPYSFTVNGGLAQTDSVFTNLQGGLNTFVVSDDYGCTKTLQVTIFEPANIVSTNTFANLTCNGLDNGQIVVSTNGGVAPYAYALNTSVAPQITGTFNNLSAGTYIAYVSDSNGCLDTINNIVINDPDTLIITNVVSANVTCFGAANGSLDITATGGTLPYSYSINGGTPQTSNSFSNLSGGIYNISVTDLNNCPIATKTDTILEPTQIVLSVDSSENVTCFGGNDGVIEFSAIGGTAPYTYSINNGTSYSAVNIYTDLIAGTYNLIVKDANNCTSLVTNLNITQPPTMSLTVNVKDVSCFGAADGELTVTAINGGTGPYTISLNGVGAQLYTPNFAFSNLVAGNNYTIQITDMQGCQKSETYVVLQPAKLDLKALNKVNVSCSGLSDGSVQFTTTGGFPAYNYTFNGTTLTSANSSPVSYTNISAGTYPVYVVDNNLCSDTLIVEITQPDGLTIDSLIEQRPISCFGANDAALIVYASGGYLADPIYSDYTYAWTPSGGTDHKVGGLAAGTHTVTVTDDNGCFATASYTIANVLPIIATIVPDTSEISMGDEVELSIEIDNAAGPFTYSWSPTEGLSCTDCENPTVLIYNDMVYSVVVTDENGCTNYNYTQSYVFVDGTLFFFLPNSFTPNGDGINDQFQIFGQDIQSANMMVFNRWGELVFQGASQFDTWDGTYRGVLQPSGVYTYAISLTFLNGATVQKNGSLTMIR